MRQQSDILKCHAWYLTYSTSRRKRTGLLDLNTNRKPVSTLAKHKALVTAGDEITLFVVQHELDRLGLRSALDTKTPGTIQCPGWCMKRAAADKGAFTRVLEITTEISNADAVPVRERLLDGLAYIHKTWRTACLIRDLCSASEPKAQSVYSTLQTKRLPSMAKAVRRFGQKGYCRRLTRGFQSGLNSAKGTRTMPCQAARGCHPIAGANQTRARRHGRPPGAISGRTTQPSPTRLDGTTCTAKAVRVRSNLCWTDYGNGDGALHLAFP